MTNENFDRREDEVVEAIREEIREEIADLEDYARRGQEPPECRGYRFKVDGEEFIVHERFITGERVLDMSGHTPVAEYTLRVKIAGQPPKKVGLHETIDLRAPGIEKFKTLPRDQTEG